MIHGDDRGQKGEDVQALMGDIAANLMEAVQQGNGELLQEVGLGLGACCRERRTDREQGDCNHILTVISWNHLILNPGRTIC